MIIEKFKPFELINKQEGSTQFLWCPLRKKWLVYTPEEWVRQQWIAFFLHQNYPVGWMIAEYAFKYVNKKTIRIDLALLNASQQVELLAEFKNANYVFQTSDLEQLLRYAKILQPRFLLLSNFEQTYWYEVSQKTWQVI
jgi:hypothetical protein